MAPPAPTASGRTQPSSAVSSMTERPMSSSSTTRPQPPQQQSEPQRVYIKASTEHGSGSDSELADQVYSNISALRDKLSGSPDEAKRRLDRFIREAQKISTGNFYLDVSTPDNATRLVQRLARLPSEDQRPEDLFYGLVRKIGNTPGPSSPKPDDYEALLTELRSAAQSTGAFTPDVIRKLYSAGASEDDSDVYEQYYGR
ncbi:hypothetical protein [Thermoplasma sp. Kam2015]|uniref:hypothetical protein n=1 Tax=Thermoplasma sp. Kam2015 TaxID=2094122 RepID=UPI001293E61E|nr:hypothetical protein [Thermoplasma sp. Kam2015]